VLEDRCIELIQSAGLPRPRVQWSVIAGRKRRRLDLFFDEHGVVVEAEGYASHSSVDAFEADRERNNSLLLLNLRVLHWTWTAIEVRPDELIAELYALMNLSV
jgi:very-short-patch-repair endonuclease